MYHIVSEKLKEAMQIKNVTLNQLSNKCDIPYETLRNLYYAKNKNPRIETLFAVCKALDISLDYLTGLTKYNKDEMEMLSNYQKCGEHGKYFLTVISRFEADYSTSLKLKSANKHFINCLIPDGHVEDGFEYTTCQVKQIETVFEEAFLAIEITTENFIPSFFRGDIISLANRYPKEGEKAVYYKDGKVYFREYRFENGKVLLKTLNGKGNDFILDDMRGFKLLGTYINIIR